MLVVKSFGDLRKFVHKEHADIVGRDYCLFYSDLIRQGVTADSIANDCGFQVYFESVHEMYEPNEEVSLHKNSGFIEFTFMGGTGWEAVDVIEDLYRVTMLMNDEYGIVYYIPQDIVKGHRLDDLLRAYL